jgi:hypothetical protein
MVLEGGVPVVWGGSGMAAFKPDVRHEIYEILDKYDVREIDTARGYVCYSLLPLLLNLCNICKLILSLAQ